MSYCTYCTGLSYALLEVNAVREKIGNQVIVVMSERHRWIRNASWIGTKHSGHNLQERWHQELCLQQSCECSWAYGESSMSVGKTAAK